MANLIIQPGATIGVLGDGQLGRMLAIAAAQLGYRVAVLGPEGRTSPAGQVAYWAEKWENGCNVSNQLLAEFCTMVSVVLLEWENVPVSLLQRIQQRGVAVRPGTDALRAAQDRFYEKRLARRLGIPTTPFGNIQKEDDLVDVQEDFGRPSILKTRNGGYDGLGQVSVAGPEELPAAWAKLHRQPCILEEVVNLKREISVIVARVPEQESIRRQCVTYGPFENVHRDGILRTTRYVHTSEATQSEERVAIRAATTLAEELDIHGLLAIEFFVTQEGSILFNEMAPRPHNSGHLTIECARTSQFEQYVRAACNLPLGSVEMVSGTMQNIIGDEVVSWFTGGSSLSREKLHLYGKREVRSGRKMGHVTILDT